MAKVAVIMASYNGMPYLPDAIDSILNQTYRDFELIVVNDGSTDNSAEYLAQRQQTDPRLIVHYQTNQGQQAAANLGIRSSDSLYIARMDSDDWSYPDRLAKQVAFMDAHPEVGLSGGQIKRMGAKKSGLVSNMPMSHEDILTGLIHNHHAMCNSCVIFRRDVFDRIGGYWEHNISEDWDMFLRTAEVSQLANLPDCILDYRMHVKSINARRILEAQLHNEYAAELFQRRASGRPSLSYDEFVGQHRCNRWPMSWQFFLDSHSVGQYRLAIGEIYSGHAVKGYARLGLSMMMSPLRTLRRVVNIAAKPFASSRA